MAVHPCFDESSTRYLRHTFSATHVACLARTPVEVISLNIAVRRFSPSFSLADTNQNKTSQRTAKMVKQKVLLLIHDGWGVGNHGQKGNAIEAAETPCMSGLAEDKNNAYSLIQAHGLSVGLVDGLMGNSEVG